MARLVERFSRVIENEVTASKFEAIDALSHTDGEIALRFWQTRPADGIRLGRDLPARSIAKLLSRIVICEPVEDGEFRVHLAGSALRHRFGRDITGETMASVHGPEEAVLRRARTHRVREAGEPLMYRVTHFAGIVEVLRTEVLQIPIVAPNGVDLWVLNFAFYL